MLERRLVLPHAIADKVVVVLHPGEQLDPAALIQLLIARMLRFVVPQYVEFADEIPKTEATVRAQEMRLRVDPRSTRTPGTGRRQASYRIDRNAAVHGYTNSALMAISSPRWSRCTGSSIETIDTERRCVCS